MCEIDAGLIARADRVFVDSRSAVLAEAGDFIQPIGAGIFGAARIDGELGEVLDGRLPGRRDRGEISLFKSVGFAALDLTAARAIYEKAKAAGVGRELAL